MTGKKVKLAFIVNDSARKATYKKRKRGFFKKMDELTTLCDVKACAIMYSQYEARPVVWPSPSGAREVILSFKRLPEMEKTKKMVSQEEFLRQRVAKAHEQLKKQQKENREKEMSHVMYQCLTGKNLQNMSLLDLSDLSHVIDHHLNEINKRVEILNKEDDDNIPNLNINVNINNNINEYDLGNGNIILQQAVPGQTQAVGMGPMAKGLQGHKAIQIQLPWSSFTEMMSSPAPLPPPSPPIMHDPNHLSPHYYNPQMGMGIGMTGFGMGGGFNVGRGSSSNGGGDNVNMNTMMMGGEFTGNDQQYHGHGVNHAMWYNSNNNNGFFPW